MAWSGGFQDFNQNRPNSFNAQRNSISQPKPNPPPSISSSCEKIAEVSPGKPITRLVGIIIAKDDPRHFPSKKDPSKENYVLSFTLRDSPIDFINVTCWGGDAYITQLSEQFRIGDVVEIENPMVQSKPSDGSDERFRAWTPSLYQLSLSENRSSVRLYGGWNANDYTQLYHIPVKPSNDFYTIGDVLTNGQNISGEMINMLVAVKMVGAARDITTKYGKQMKKCEVKLFDETSPSFILTLWSEEIIHLAQSWTPRDTVLFIADVKVSYDNFKKTMAATATSKTIFTANPDTREAHSLFQYAQSAELTEDTDMSSMYGGGDAGIDLNTIKTVYNIEQIKAKLSVLGESGGTECGVVYAAISRLDIDRDDGAGFSVRCCKCRWRVDTSSGTCTNRECPAGSADVVAETETSFDLRVALSDHTGTLDNCILSGAAAENMFGCKVEEFINYNEDQKTALKWQFLLERAKIFLKFSLPTYERSKSVIKLLAWVPADMEEVAAFAQ